MLWGRPLLEMPTNARDLITAAAIRGESNVGHAGTAEPLRIRGGSSIGHPIILLQRIDVRVWGARFRAAGRERNGRAYLVDTRRRR